MKGIQNENFRSMNKGELHSHLFGAVSSSVALNVYMSEKQDKDPSLTIEDFRVPPGCNSLTNYLSPWKFLRLIPRKKSNLQVITDDVFSSLKKENVQFVELRNTVVNIAKLNDSIDTTTAMRWMLECLGNSSEKYAIKFGLILTIQRGQTAYEDFLKLFKSYEELEFPVNIVGFDIAGDESKPIDHKIAPKLIEAKKKHGLGVTIHAGETGEIKNIIEAINIFKADRIGHGIAALQDFDLLNTLRKKNICLEICPKSNILTGLKNNYNNLVKSAVPFVICSDNAGIQNSTITDDYVTLASIIGDELLGESMFLNQCKYSFLKEINYEGMLYNKK